MDNTALANCDYMTVQLQNIILAATMYGRDVSYYESELHKWNDKRNAILSQRQDVKIGL